MENSLAAKSMPIPRDLASSRRLVKTLAAKPKPSLMQRRKGRRHCNICGNGKIVPCGRCRGRGEANTPYLPFSIDSVKKPCPACQGRGWFPCPDCYPPPSSTQ